MPLAAVERDSIYATAFGEKYEASEDDDADPEDEMDGGSNAEQKYPWINEPIMSMPLAELIRSYYTIYGEIYESEGDTD